MNDPTASLGISPISTFKILTMLERVNLFKRIEFSNKDNSLQILNTSFNKDCPLFTVYVNGFESVE